MRNTLAALARRFYWRGITRDVKDFCLQCLHCVTTRGGNRVPRPLGVAAHAASSNLILHWDFLFVQRAEQGVSKHGYSYILCLKDGYDSYCELVSCTSCNTEAAVEALMEWFKRYGVVDV